MTVFMKHPALPDTEPAPTTQAAFDKVWATKGWEIVDAEQVTVQRSQPEQPKAEGRRARTENQEG